jgi:hypothetical protein
MAHLGQACGGDAAHISHSENGDIHTSNAPIALRLLDRGIIHGRSPKLCYPSRGLISKSAIEPPSHVFQTRFITLNWIFPCSRHRPITAQIIRMNLPQLPSRRSGLSSQAFCTRHRSSAPLSEGRESNPTRGSGMGPYSRAMSSDLSRESRPILAGIP